MVLGQEMQRGFLLREPEAWEKAESQSVLKKEVDL